MSFALDSLYNQEFNCRKEVRNRVRSKRGIQRRETSEGKAGLSTVLLEALWRERRKQGDRGT